MKKFLLFSTGILVGALGYAAYKYVTEPADEVSADSEEDEFEKEDFFDDEDDVELTPVIEKGEEN